MIDKKSITAQIGVQAEEAYNFTLRQINESAWVEGVYTISRWEYPVKALREILRNARGTPPVLAHWERYQGDDI